MHNHWGETAEKREPVLNVNIKQKKTKNTKQKAFT